MRTYTKGSKIKTLSKAIKRIEKGKPFYFNGRYLAAGFVANWSISRLKIMILHGNIYKAVAIEV